MIQEHFCLSLSLATESLWLLWVFIKFEKRFDSLFDFSEVVQYLAFKGHICSHVVHKCVLTQASQQPSVEKEFHHYRPGLGWVIKLARYGFIKRLAEKCDVLRYHPTFSPAADWLSLFRAAASFAILGFRRSRVAKEKFVPNQPWQCLDPLLYVVLSELFDRVPRWAAVLVILKWVSFR